MDSLQEADEALEPLNPKTAVSVGDVDSEPPTSGGPTAPTEAPDAPTEAPAAPVSATSASSRFEVEKVQTPESPGAAADDGAPSRHTRFAVDVIEVEPQQPVTGHNITIHITDTSKANGT